MTKKPTVKAYAKLDCPNCGGRGIVVDRVPAPFAPGTVGMESYCECATEDMSERTLNAVDDGILVLEVLPHPQYLKGLSHDTNRDDQSH